MRRYSIQNFSDFNFTTDEHRATVNQNKEDGKIHKIGVQKRRSSLAHLFRAKANENTQIERKQYEKSGIRRNHFIHSQTSPNPNPLPSHHHKLLQSRCSQFDASQYTADRNSHSRRNQSLTPQRRSISDLFSQTSITNQMRSKLMRVVVLGSRAVGKTELLEQLTHFQDPTTSSAFDDRPYLPTIEDTYQIQLQADAKEIIIFHDTAGVPDYGPTVEIKRAYINVADAFLLVYSVQDYESFNRVDMLKKHIEKFFVKEKKEIPIIVVGTKADLSGRKIDPEFALRWANKERGNKKKDCQISVKLFELSARDRGSIVEIVHYLSSRHFHTLKESKFSISKRLKPEKSNAQIVMDF